MSQTNTPTDHRPQRSLGQTVEDVVRDRDAELNAIYDNSPLIMVLVDSKCQIRKMNAAALCWTADDVKHTVRLRPGELLRCLKSLEDPRGCGFSNHCQHCALRRCAIDTLTTGQSHSQVEANMPFAVAGEVRNLTFLVSTARLFANEEPLVLVSLMNVTQRRQLEEELRRAKELAEAANWAKSEFLARMSHEVRTPMTAILGFADLLLAGRVATDESRGILETIKNNGTALLTLVDEVLDLSRIEANRMSVAIAECSLQELIDDVINTLRIRAEEKGLTLRGESDASVPATIWTDAAHLRQILINLIDNAIKFTERGEIRLSARYLKGPQLDSQLEIKIVDTGCGIPSERLSELFQPFVQIASANSASHRGFGLGLVISQQIARSLGGDITVSSQLGSGSTFTLRICDPLTAQAVEASTVPSAISSGTPAAASPVRHRRVLVAEDNSDVQALLGRFLRGMDLSVDFAENGRLTCEKAIASRAAGSPYDLILMDIQMPEMDGYEATRELRQLDWRGPIIALTAYAMLGDREKCMAAGCDGYLAKPVQFGQLQEILARCFTAPKTA